MNKENLELIKEMPKAVLHLHLDGSLRPETVYKRLQKNPLKEDEIEEWFNKGYIFESDKNVLLEVAKKGKNITLEEVKEKLSVDIDCRDLNEYLEKFALPGAVLQTEEEIEESTYELFEDLSKQNVIYAEVRFAPAKHIYKGLKYEQVVKAAIDGMERAKKEFNIDGNLLLCCMRGNNNVNENLNTIVVAKKHLKKGVCGVDLAGAEALFPTETFKDIFEIARKNNIPFTIHAGEADGPQSILEALKMGAKRIGHGVRCLADKNLVKKLREEGIVLEICPISNLQTKAVEDLQPLEEICKNGLLATISTDNDTVSNTNIVDEYKNILENSKLEINDLYRMQINAIAGAFIEPSKKAELKAKINEWQKKKENLIK